MLIGNPREASVNGLIPPGEIAWGLFMDSVVFSILLRIRTELSAGPSADGAKLGGTGKYSGWQRQNGKDAKRLGGW